MGETGGEVMTRGMLFISPKWINKMLVIFVHLYISFHLEALYLLYSTEFTIHL